MAKPNLPKPTLGRLPRYLSYLRTLPNVETQNVSATGISRALGLGEVQVRKDLHAACGKGKPRVGYNAAELIAELEQILGIHTRNRAILVGAGKLGQALMEFDGFETFGIQIVAGFDKQPDPEEELNTPIYPMERLQAYCQTEQIKLAVVTVPQDAAQEVCDRLIEAGISAIWSFTPVTVPEGVLLLRENLALSLAHLCSQVRERDEGGAI